MKMEDIGRKMTAPTTQKKMKKMNGKMTMTMVTMISAAMAVAVAVRVAVVVPWWRSRNGVTSVDSVVTMYLVSFSSAPSSLSNLFTY